MENVLKKQVIVNGGWKSSRDSRRPECLWRSERDWDDVSSFCEAVMLAKKEAGHVRERTSSPPSLRERYSGRRGSRKVLWSPRRVRVASARTELDPCIPRIAFRARLKEPSEYLRWCLVWLMPDPDLRTT
ncbi:hypothetical protein SFRURICE_019895 [Spodoptera frugiperda]|nr:hypothetical protein SFRURICE_019895 [Spodoptera frugiperda]